MGPQIRRWNTLDPELLRLSGQELRVGDAECLVQHPRCRARALYTRCDAEGRARLSLAVFAEGAAVRWLDLMQRRVDHLVSGRAAQWFPDFDADSERLEDYRKSLAAEQPDGSRVLYLNIPCAKSGRPLCEVYDSRGRLLAQPLTVLDELGELEFTPLVHWHSVWSTPQSYAVQLNLRQLKLAPRGAPEEPLPLGCVIDCDPLQIGGPDLDQPSPGLPEVSASVGDHQDDPINGVEEGSSDENGLPAAERQQDHEPDPEIYGGN